VPVPSTIMCNAAARYYLDIGAAVSRSLLGFLEKFSKNKITQSGLHRLSRVKVAFQLKIAATCH